MTPPAKEIDLDAIRKICQDVKQWTPLTAQQYPTASCKHLHTLADALLAHLSMDRNAVIEECARIAELECWSATDPFEATIRRAQRGIAAAIRALKSPAR